METSEEFDIRMLHLLAVLRNKETFKWWKGRLSPIVEVGHGSLGDLTLRAARFERNLEPSLAAARGSRTLARDSRS